MIILLFCLTYVQKKEKYVTFQSTEVELVKSTSMLLINLLLLSLINLLLNLKIEQKAGQSTLRKDGDIWVFDYLTIHIAKLPKSIFATDEERRKGDIIQTLNFVKSDYSFASLHHLEIEGLQKGFPLSWLQRSVNKKRQRWNISFSMILFLIWKI